MENTETIQIKGREYQILSHVTFENQPLNKADFNSRGIREMATVRLTTGRVEKAAYISLSGQFAGWVQLW